MPKTNAVSILGTNYDSVSSAARDLGLNVHAVYGRLDSNSKKWDDWIYVDEERINKEIWKKPEVPVSYQFIHMPTGQFYAGSTIDMAGRQSNHLWNLKNNRHRCNRLQELWDTDSDLNNWRWMSIVFNRREDAYDNEQETFEKYKDSGLLLNSVLNARSPISEVMDRPGEKEKAKKSQARALTTYSKEQRDALIEKMRQGTLNRWAKEGSREAWGGSNNPFSKKVMVDGIVYGSVKEAMRQLKMDEKKIRTRARDPRFPNYTFDIPPSI